MSDKSDLEYGLGVILEQTHRKIKALMDKTRYDPDEPDVIDVFQETLGLDLLDSYSNWDRENGDD